MKPRTLLACSVVFLSAIVLAKSPTTAPAHNYRLVQPWGKLKSLSDEQREKIYHIHRQSLDQIKQIQAQERKDILALLSDDQKLELVRVDEADTVARKLKPAPATQSAEAANENPQP